MQIRRFRGRRTVMSFRLCSRAPWTTSSSAAMERPLYFSERVFGRGSVLRHAVREDAPGRGVPRPREEVAPVLDHEPRTGRGGRGRRSTQLPRAGELAAEEGGENGEAERELMDSHSEEEDPGAQPMTFETKHLPRLCRLY